MSQAFKITMSQRAKAILEEFQQNLEGGISSIGLLNDEEIHQVELEKIFGKRWNYMAHESEIPDSGDYVLRYIGNDAFAVTRGDDGKVHVLLDVCPHRGASVCRAEKGKSSHLRCPYHGWTFKNNGDLVGTPSYMDAYKGLDRKQWGLTHAPRVENYHGFIFASLDENAPSLRESLDGMAWYLDMIFSLQNEGMEVLGEPQRFVIKSNWKIAAENFSGDDYHLMYLHKSTYDIGVMPVPLKENMKGYHIKAGNGHALSFSIDMESNDPIFFFFPEEIVNTFNLENLSDKQLELARGSRVCVGNIFPNISFLMLPLSPDPKNIPPTPFFTWRVWRPINKDEIEVFNWFFMYKNTPKEFKEAAYRAAIATFGIAGVFEMDDAIPWEAATKNAKGTFARKVMKLNLQMGMDGMSSSKQVMDWPFPGIAYYPRFEEGNQRHMYSYYLKEMLKED
ncbi:Rieske (2Fe-2S) domain-containing protein [Schinkia azotoformans MEV2011]|uniref:Rieske (2Fe-2S) domain-containing protein n=1 Tax=Schinkia azotoformans MEV2011 TaxID=1348973 RepID=A0A072NSC8_SCHAZ|nr:Rieske 2Fe-2S domain-containing protein [Schinkia azotoformans]KEF36095.1 Rieske (2Fe-2S) domain-containing protein [Schinkia azotoformans MEV2011]MEC1695504.1 Rieske 2Fe-2S domain-containing protein [Schinkia azotoformans]MEC1727153.1 Rieske 2Fe-2S domain-containing protein [Schinkia azotoformans]MEC1773023.1 Rieske 2Fe-2S domain-containing protein [Schinkia azotoformans]MEC1781972.1 Rieske 2Fe-2S domain-containing protein [Schinkia azotoformans]